MLVSVGTDARSNRRKRGRRRRSIWGTRRTSGSDENFYVVPKSVDVTSRP